jgi:hypothetical protein
MITHKSHKQGNPEKPEFHDGKNGVFFMGHVLRGAASPVSL